MKHPTQTLSEIATENPALAIEAPQASAGQLTNETPLSPDLLSRHLLLQDAATHGAVPYDTFITANRAGRLSLFKDEAGRLQIDVVEFIHYMIVGAPPKYRWKAKLVSVDQIRCRTELQPRVGSQGNMVGKLEEHIRAGGAIHPLWLMRDGNEDILVDGHRRLEAAQRADRAKIPAIHLRVPFGYAAAIARIGNLRHGINLTSRDQKAAVLKHIEDNPTAKLDLQAGRLSQAKLAQQLGVSVATVSRAMREKKNPEEREVVSVGQVFSGLGSLLKGVGDLRLQAEELAVAIVVLRAAGEALQANLSLAEIREAKVAATKGNSAIAQSLPPALVKLLDRRGGDRRRHDSREDS